MGLPCEVLLHLKPIISSFVFCYSTAAMDIPMYQKASGRADVEKFCALPSATYVSFNLSWSFAKVGQLEENYQKVLQSSHIHKSL
jgi:hypothetical protein